MKDGQKLEKLKNSTRIFFRIRPRMNMFTCLFTFTINEKRYPRRWDNSNRTKFFFRKTLLFKKKLSTSIGPTHCDKFRGKRLSTFSTDNEHKNQQKICVEHEPYKISSPKETSFSFTECLYKTNSILFGVVDFKAISEKNTMLIRKLTKNKFKQMPVGVTCNMTSDIKKSKIIWELS